MGRAFEEGALTLDGEDKEEEEEEEDGTSFVLRVKKTNRVWGEGGKKGPFSSFLRYVARAFKKVYNHGWDKVINRKGGGEEEVVRLPIKGKRKKAKSRKEKEKIAAALFLSFFHYFRDTFHLVSSCVWFRLFLPHVLRSEQKEEKRFSPPPVCCWQDSSGKEKEGNDKWNSPPPPPPPPTPRQSYTRHGRYFRPGFSPSLDPRFRKSFKFMRKPFSSSSSPG